VSGIGGIIGCGKEDSLVMRVHTDIVNWFIRLKGSDGMNKYITSANGSYLKSALAEVGGFDESMGMYGGEETDLALRIKASGGRLKLDETICVNHRKAMDTASFLRKYFLFGKAARKIYNRHQGRKKGSLTDYARLYLVSMANKPLAEKPLGILLITFSQAFTLAGYIAQAGGEIFESKRP